MVNLIPNLLTLWYGVLRLEMATSMHLCSKASQKRVETLSGINRDIIGTFHGTQYPQDSTAKCILFSKSHPSFEYLWKTCIPSISSASLQPLRSRSMPLIQHQFSCFSSLITFLIKSCSITWSKKDYRVRHMFPTAPQLHDWQPRLILTRFGWKKFW